MALDHYVSQVHLRNFNSADGYLRAIRKKDLKSFRTNARAVCRTEEGNTNSYLSAPRIVEDEFLPLIEPRYNASLEKLRENKVDQEAILCISGFLAYFVTCSPTAMRTGAPFIAKNVEATAKVLSPILGRSPASLGGKSMSELIEGGEVKALVDPKFPQAVGTTNIARQASIFGNSPWELLRNTHRDSPFFTSDYPAALANTDIDGPLVRIVPLAPDLAVRIVPDIRLRGAPADLTFPRFRARQRVLNRQEVRSVNQLIVRCAEDLVFFCDERDWVAPFVKRNANFQVRAEVVQLPATSGVLTVGRLRVGPRDRDPQQSYDRAA